MVIFLPELADEDLTAQLDRASGYITAVGGTIKEVLTDSPWGRRRLAYPIRFNSQDFRDGFYAVYHFDLVPSAMADIERELKLDTRIMRYLVVHDDPKAGEKNIGGPEGDAAEDVAVAPAPSDDVPAATVADRGVATTPEAPTEPAQPAPVPDPGETTSDVAEMSAPVEAQASEGAAAGSAVAPATAEEDNASGQAAAEEPAPASTPEDAPADPEQED
jgi:small subunit ribosomal protein S6